MAEKRPSQRNTYSKYVPPFLDTGKGVLTFSHMRFHIPSPSLLKAMYERLTANVKEKDYNGILATLEALEPYRINTKVSSTKKQTKEVEV